MSPMDMDVGDDLILCSNWISSHYLRHLYVNGQVSLRSGPAISGPDPQPQVRTRSYSLSFRLMFVLLRGYSRIINFSLPNEITPLPTKCILCRLFSILAQTPPFFAQTPPIFAQPSTFARPPAAPWISGS